MGTEKKLNNGILYFLNKNTGEYEKLCDAISEVNLEEPEQEVVMGYDLSSNRDFTGTFTLKPPVVVDAEYKEVNE